MCSACSLHPGIRYRIAVNPDGSTVRVARRDLANVMPSCPKAQSRYPAFLYVCPVTKNYIVATRADRHNHYVCYQTFKTRTAALMYALTRGL